MRVHLFILQGGGVLWSLELNAWFIFFLVPCLSVTLRL